MRKSKDKRLVCAGIDVSKEKLDVNWKGLDGNVRTFQVRNDAGGHADLVSSFASTKIDEVHAVFEATGPYSTALARFLCSQPARVQAMMVQPAAARQFARAGLCRAKTDRVDAASLREFAERMPFVPTVLPSEHIAAVRSLERHMTSLIDRGAALKNQRHAAVVAGDSHPVLLEVIDAELVAIQKIVAQLEATILEELRKEEKVVVVIERMTQLPGIKDRVVTRLLPELLALPGHLTPREAVAYVGLDPKPRQSGQKGLHGSWSISKQGNAKIRRNLYMVALTAVRHLAPARAFYERLRERGKLKKVAIVAVMRKLLAALWVMITRDTAFDATKFTNTPIASAV